MTPSDKVVSDAIRNDVRRMFIGPDRDNLTVNKIRQNVAAELHLENGFFKQGSWKQQSKNIVRTENVISTLLLAIAFCEYAKVSCRKNFSSSKRPVRSSRPSSRLLRQ